MYGHGDFAGGIRARYAGLKYLPEFCGFLPHAVMDFINAALIGIRAVYLMADALGDHIIRT